MKSVPVTQNHLCIPTRISALAMLLLMLVCASSCQKEPECVLQEQQVVQSQTLMRSSVEMDQQVVQHIQWVINNVIPLIADETVAAAIQAGNTSSSLVTARLQELGFSNFDQFATAFNSSSSTIQAAIQAGNLTQAQLIQIAQGHTFDFSQVGGGAGTLPCTEQFALELSLMPISVATAASGGPLAAVIAGAVHVTVAYLNFKNCLRTTYPGADIP